MKGKDIQTYQQEIADIASAIEVITKEILNESYKEYDGEKFDDFRLEGLAIALQGLQRWLGELPGEDISITACDVNSRDGLGLNEILVRIKLHNDEEFDQETMESAVHGMLTFLSGPSLKFSNGKVKRFPLEEFEIISG